MLTFFAACSASAATRFRAGQRLKPHWFRMGDGTAEAVPYKDLAAGTQPVLRSTQDKKPAPPEAATLFTKD
jgi:hypothetical protein